MNADLPLKDIHLPEAVAWWPPAPGWWILAALCLTLAAWLLYRYRRNQGRRHLRHSMEREWHELQQRFQQHQDPRQLTRELSVLLRRVAMSVTGRDMVAGQTGDSWLQQLDALADRRLFDTTAGRQLISAPYQPATKIDTAELLAISRQWLTLVEKKQVSRADL